MKLIVGLGNPGDKYQDTLHNVGFAAVNRLAESIAAGNWTNKFKGKFIQSRVNQYALLLLKPQTYMNASGDSVLACKQFYKIELRDMLVISDDVDRPAGSLRYRVSGGHGGHNGIRDIMRQCGGDQFHRIKIGVGRPSDGKKVADYVLSKPPVDVQVAVDEAISDIVRYLKGFIAGQPIQIQPKPKKGGNSDMPATT